MKRSVNQWLMLLAAGLLAAFGMTARADEVLYWMVDNPTIAGWCGVQTTAAEMGIEGARVAAFKTADTEAYLASRTGTPPAAPSMTGCDVVYLDLYHQEAGGAWVLDKGVTTVELSDGKMGGESHASVGVSLGGDYSAYSFAIELYTWEGTEEAGNWVFAAMSESETYAALTNYRQSLTSFPEGVWMPSAYAVPEPTSGLLMLMGLALLGLKRKKEAKGFERFEVKK